MVESDVAFIADMGGALGLALNPSKWEVIVSSPSLSLPTILDSFVRIDMWVTPRSWLLPCAGTGALDWTRHGVIAVLIWLAPLLG